MATTNYVSANGMIVGESTGGVSRAYGTDALGSVVATYSGAVRENTYQYKPYGGLLSKTGVASDPNFLWNGGSGYRATSLVNSGYYVRARHYSNTMARWTTRDTYWPYESPYVYVTDNPSSFSDLSGHSASNSAKPDCNCCAISLTFSSQKCTGPGGEGYPRCLEYGGSTQKPAFRGHNLTLTIDYELSPPSASQPTTHCLGIGWSEVQIFDGVMMSNQNGMIQNSTSWPDALKCEKNLATESCRVGIQCQVVDVPGIDMYYYSGTGYHTRDLTITATVANTNPQFCPTVTATWHQLLGWGGNFGYPKPWVPKILMGGL